MSVDPLDIAARQLTGQLQSDGDPRIGALAVEYIETIAYADADAILHMLHVSLEERGWYLPVWARLLAYRLACLQRPQDAELLREAANDLVLHGPDWDDIAAQLMDRALAVEGRESS